MGRVLFVTSFKGGVGKTTVSANLSAALAMMGYKVLAVDGDYGMRCLDMTFGAESESVYNINDVAEGKCRIEDACVKCEIDCPYADKKGELMFVSAPIKTPENFVPAKEIVSLFRSLRKKYDFIIIDSSAEESAYYKTFAEVADAALVITSHQSIAVRAAEKTTMRLEELGFKNIRLIVNMFHAEYVKSGDFKNIEQIISASSVKLIGVIPFDLNAVYDQEKGITVFATEDIYASPYEAAIYNIASRIVGNNIPLFDGVLKPRKKKTYKFTK